MTAPEEETRMTARSPRRRLPAAGALLAACSLLLTGCGEGAAKSAAAPGASDAPLARLLPDDVRKAGVLKVGSMLAIPPLEYKVNGGTPVGADVGLAKALGRQLGVRVEVVDTVFPDLIPGLLAKRFDLVMSSMTDTRERQGMGIDFVDYLQAGSSLMVGKGNPKRIGSLDDLCGTKVALLKDTLVEVKAREQSAKCTAAGKRPVTVLGYSGGDPMMADLAAGTADAGINDFPAASFGAQTVEGGSAIELTGEQIAPSPYGIAVAHSNARLRDAVKAAFQAVIDNGQYTQLLSRWALQDGAVSSAQVNGGT
jgi:polar amino acid transport system substrate-binding protein